MEKQDETPSLFSAGKVQGTNVYNTQGESLGEVYDVMIDKRSGKLLTLSCRLADSSGWATITTRCPGIH
jgi:sporulation protein YlmC with PRC-barrel domain